MRAWILIAFASLMFVAGAYLKSDSNVVLIELLLMLAGFMLGLVITDSLTPTFDELDEDEQRIAILEISDLMSDENSDDVPYDTTDILESRINSIEDKIHIIDEAFEQLEHEVNQLKKG